MQKKIQRTPNKKELSTLFETAFACVIGDDGKGFSSETDQSLPEWFDIDALISSLHHGDLWEIRDEEKLIGAAFIGKQQPMTWPDGKKAELFILGVDPAYRGKGIGKELVSLCEESAKRIGAKQLLVNTNTLMASTVQFYVKQGYKELGVLHDYYDNGDAVFLSKHF